MPNPNESALKATARAVFDANLRCDSEDHYQYEIERILAEWLQPLLAKARELADAVNTAFTERQTVTNWNTMVAMARELLALLDGAK